MGSDSAFVEPFYKEREEIKTFDDYLKKVELFSEMIIRGFPEDFKLEDGQYECVCHLCGEHFIGHKRRITCKPCEEKEK